MALIKLPAGGSTEREIVEFGLGNALPNLDTLPDREEFDITQAQLEAELSDIANGDDIRVVARDKTSMVSITESQTAMDEVFTSQTARDAIGTDGDGYDAIAQLAMAIGKYVAGIAGLTPTNYADIDAVASDTAAMDAVSASSTAMDAVTASRLAYTAILGGGQTAPLWNSKIGSESYWVDVSTQSVPRTTDNYQISSIDLESGFNPQQYSGDISSTGYALNYERLGNEEIDESALTEYVLDLSEYSSLEIKTYSDDLSDAFRVMYLRADGTDMFRITNPHDWTNRSVDISSYGDGTSIEIGVLSEQSSDITAAHCGTFTDLRLIP